MICRNCGAGLEASSIDSSMGMITCSHCGTLHDLPRTNDNNTSQQSTNAAPVKPKRVEVNLPKRFNLERGANGMQISWPVGSLMHGVVLLIIAGVFGYVAITSGLLLLLIPVIGIVYFAATRAFNTHYVRVDKQQLLVLSLIHI